MFLAFFQLCVLTGVLFATWLLTGPVGGTYPAADWTLFDVTVFGRRFRAYRKHIGAPEDLYMRRWILQTPRGMVRIHNILRGDHAEDFHDHPADFVSLILWRGYREVRALSEAESPWQPRVSQHADGGFAEGMWRRTADAQDYGFGDVLYRRGENLHRLELPNGPAWTLVFMGPLRRPWGYQTRDGWIGWRAYKASGGGSGQ